MIEPKAPYADCANCPLADQPCAPSFKPSNEISLIVVGEAPGYYEAQRGQPFVGPSGQLLDAVLNEVGIAPDEVYRTNAVLCRPPNNKLEGKYLEALVRCSERLQAELAQFPTTPIAALGATATEALDAFSGHSRKDGILKRRGQWYQFGDRQYLATLHPAFVLRSSGYMAQFLTDMRSITIDRSDAQDWLTVAPVVVDCSNRQDFIMWLGEQVLSKHLVAFDVETANLDPSSKLLALGLTSSLEFAWIVTGDTIREDHNLRELLTRFLDRAKLVAHNGKFDQQVLANNGLGFFDLADDTMLMHYALDEQKGTHGLKQLASAFLGVLDYEAMLVDAHFNAQERSARDYSTIPTEKLYLYLAIDCCATLALRETFDPLIDVDNVRQAYNIALAASNALQHTEFLGIKVDRPYLELVLARLEEKIAEAKDAVQNAAVPYVEAYLKTIKEASWRNPDPSWIKGTKHNSAYQQYLQVVVNCLEVNLGSWQQLQVLLYDVLGLKHTKKLSFKTKPRSTNAEALDALPDHEFVSVLQSFRRLDKIRGTYVVKLLELADSNDRVHIRFNIHGTETGRLSANDGLHGIPRPSDIWGRALRGAFIAADGKLFVIADYAQAELRAFAAESKETFLLDAYNNDEDVHGNTTKMLFPTDPVVALAQYDQDWHWSAEALEKLFNLGLSEQDAKDHWKELRTLAKNTNFGGLVYLGGAEGIASMLGGKLTATQIRPILQTLLAKMPTARAWQMDQYRKARKEGFVQSRFGNKRRFLLITDDNLDEVKKASVNAPIQNSASQLTLLSGIVLTKHGIPVVHYNHDQLMCEVPEILAESTAKLVNETMVNMGRQYFPEVSWKADVEISKRWYMKRPNMQKEQAQ